MKKLTIMMLLALAGIGSSASAYNFTVINKTNQKITVSIKPNLGSTYSWVLAPSGTTIPASEALPSSVIVPPGIDDIPQAEFSDTKVFKYSGGSAGLCLTHSSIKVNGKTVDLTYEGIDETMKGWVEFGSLGTDLCSSLTISIVQNLDGTFVAYMPNPNPYQ